LGALQLVEILLSKVPTEYAPAFRREGVFHEVEGLASRTFVTKPKEDVKNDESTPEPMATPPPPVAAFATSTPGYKKLASLALEPEDAITLRARVIRLRHLSGDEKAEHGVYRILHQLVQQFSDKAGSEKSLSDALKELASLFSSPRSSLSSFELLQSGLVDSLLALATDEDRSGMSPVILVSYQITQFLTDLVSVQRRQDIFLEAFSRKAKPMHIQAPFSVFVKKLQESLTRMEPYEVVTIAQGVDGVLNPGASCGPADTRKKIPGEVHRRCSLVNLGSG
jgi:E3 ubiquitin-protein ligase TRIP12